LWISSSIFPLAWQPGHLRSLRDAFAAVMPIFILAGLAVLVNNVVFPWVLEGETLVRFKVWGRRSSTVR
jgi:cellobiose-specific phosphotransferase system component IIC